MDIPIVASRAAERYEPEHECSAGRLNLSLAAPRAAERYEPEHERSAGRLNTDRERLVPLVLEPSVEAWLSGSEKLPKPTISDVL